MKMKTWSKLLTLCLSALLLVSMCVVSFAAGDTTELLNITFDSVPENYLTGAAGTVENGVLNLAVTNKEIYRISFGDTLTAGEYYELNYDVKATTDKDGTGIRFYDYSGIYMNYGTFSPGYGFCFRKATINGSQVGAHDVDVDAPQLDHWYTVKVEWNTAAENRYTRYTVVDRESGTVLGSVEYDSFPDWYGNLSVPTAEPTNFHVDTIVSDATVDNIVLYKHTQKPEAPTVTPGGGSSGGTEEDTPSPNVIANETFTGETALNSNWSPHGTYTVADGVLSFADEKDSYPTLKFSGVNTTDSYVLSYDVYAPEDTVKTNGLDRFLVYGANNGQSFGAYMPGTGFGFRNLGFQTQITATDVGVWYTVKCEWSMNPENTYATYSVYNTMTGAPLGSVTGDKLWTNAADTAMTNMRAPNSIYVWNFQLTGCKVDNIKIEKVVPETSVPTLRITADNIPLLDVNDIEDSSVITASIDSEDENGLLILAAYKGDELAGVAPADTKSGSVYSVTAEGSDGFAGADKIKAFFFDKRTADFKPLANVKEIGTDTELTASAVFSAATPELSNVKLASYFGGETPTVQEAGGKNGWLMNHQSKTAGNLTVNLADDFVCGLDSAQTAHVEIDYWDGDWGGFSLFYMGKDGEYKSHYVQLHDTDTWKTASFDLYDASFANDCYSNDFILLTNDTGITTPKKYYMHASYYGVIFGSLRVSLDKTSASPFDIAIETGKTGNVFFASETDGDLVFSASYTDPAGILTSGTATYTVKGYEGNTVLTKTQNFTGSADTFTITKGSIPYGVYTLEVELSGDNVSQSEVYDFSYALRAPESNMRFGTNVHFDWWEAFTHDDIDAQLELIKASGYGFVRTKVEWMDVEPNGDGQYQPLDVFWHGNQKADELGLEMLAILGNGNGAYDYWPYFLDSEELRDAYAAACTYIVSELKQYTDYYTNPNEMNAFYPEGWDTATQGTNARFFKAYSQAANEAIYAEHPEAKVISGAVAGPDLPWTEEVYNLGLLDYTDGFSFHHYNYRQGPEGTAKDIFTQARTLTDRYSTDDETWVTEHGWPTLNYDDVAVQYGRATEYEQAKWYARSFAIYSNPDIADKYFHYCFPNTNVGYFWQEDNFGIVRSHDYKTPYAAKPAYITTAAYNTIVGDATYYGDQTTDDGKYYDYKFVNDAGETIMMLWREEDVTDKTYTFSTDKAKVEIYDMYGNKTVQDVSGGSVTLTMTDAPIYVKPID